MTLRFGFLLAWGLILTAADGNGQFDREKEVYRVFSLLLTNPGTSHGPDTNPKYLIRSMTRVESQRPCVRPPVERQSEFAEALADFEARKGRPRVLKREFSLRKPYELLNEEQVKTFQEERGWPKPEGRASAPQFKGVTDLFIFSDVYFSKNGRLALTALSSWCGGLCGQHQWKVFEKLPTGEWHEHRSWVTCFTVAACRHGCVEQ